jgi:5-methylcytosine-specific restriction endonuclease McrA
MPRAPKACGKPGCEERVRGRRYCEAHTVAWEGSARAGATRSRADKQLRAQVLAEEPVCACGAPSTEAGHIVAHARGGPYTRDNLTGQCRACNLAALAEDRRGVGGHVRIR